MIIQNQQLAIDSRNNNILLSASAGTGKTYTMVKRVLSLLESGADISEILVLAFGNDASKEMKERIEKGLSELAKADVRFYPQLKKLKIASISTIHAFALEIAKTYFAVSGASPKAQILLGADEDVLKATAMEKVFLDQYENADPEFLSLVEYFIQGRKDDKLKADVARLYSFSRNMPKGEFEKTFFETLDNNVLQGAYLQIAKNKAQSLLESYLLKTPVHEVYQAQYNQCYEILKAIINAKDLSEIRDISQVEFLRKLSPKKGSEESLFLACENFYTLVRKKVKDFAGGLCGDTAEGFESLQFGEKYRDIAQRLFNLTSLFETEYSALKQKKDYVDFSDTEHMLLAVLRDEKSRIELNSRFKYIFCDEYQDVSKIQEEILTLLSRGGNLFTVGDIKQNIYGFRACDQSVIKNRERKIQSSGDGLLLPMNTNFRSHADILEFVNSVFSASMTNPDICEYEKSSMFEAMTDFPDTGGVEIAISKKKPSKEVERLDVYSVIQDKGSPREEVNAEAEASHIAEFVKRYLGKTFDFNGEVRKVRLSDFAILLRKTSGNFASTISRVLENDGLPNFIVSSESTLKSHTKVLFLVDFLKTIACPFDDVPLYSTLVSPFFDIPDSVLFEIRNSFSGKFFHECFFGFAGSVAVKYQLEKMPYQMAGTAETAGTTETAETAGTAETADIAQAESKTQTTADIFAFNFSPILENSSATSAELAVATFLQAYQKYRTIASVSCSDMLKTAIADNLTREKITLLYGESEWAYARELINFIDSLPDTSLAYACEKLEKAVETIKFSASETAPNAISIMTMHKSKGLEFPFTIIAGTGTKYNDMDTNATLLFHKDYGIAFPYRDIETRKNSNTFEKIALKNIMRRDICDEELRLLYVALTRAKYKLLITGTLDCDFYIENNLVVSDKIPKLHSLEDFYNINSHLKIILASLVATSYKSNYQITRITETAEKSEPEILNFDRDLSSFAGLSEKFASLENENKTFDIIPAKFTATQRLENFAQMKPSAENTDSDFEILEKYEVGKVLDFALKQKEKSSGTQESSELKTKPSSAEIGTNYHKILEDVPFFETRERIADFVSCMVENGEVIDFEYDIEKIARLTNNPIFAGLNLHREVPFVMETDSQFLGLSTGTPVLCQGIIDCVFESGNGGLILVDYKATRIKSRQILADKYRPQLETYKIACEKILRKTVEKCYIYSIFSEDLIEVDC
ncbi:MAG: UvrD-helicase domain-containing protein [Bacillota bacterium]